MNEMLMKLLDKYNKTEDVNSKIELAIIVHSLLEKRFPDEYKQRVSDLKVSEVIDLYKVKGRMFLGYVDSYTCKEGKLILTKNNNDIIHPLVDVNEQFKVKEKSELDSFFIKTFFVNPVRFEQYQIAHFFLNKEA